VLDHLGHVRLPGTDDLLERHEVARVVGEASRTGPNAPRSHRQDPGIPERAQRRGHHPSSGPPPRSRSWPRSPVGASASKKSINHQKHQL